MNVLITGANGYIGRHVTELLVKLGHTVYAPVRSINKSNADHLNYVQMDIFEDDILNYIPLPDVCIHLAWDDINVHNSPRHMYNLSKHVKFLNDMIDAEVKSISILGTMHEIGYHEGMVDGDTPCAPMSQYGISKNALRESILLYAKNKKTSVKWLRAFYALGDDKNSKSVFSKILIADGEKQKTFPFSTGKNKYDYIDVDELSLQIIAASIQNNFEGIINVCSGKPVSLSEKAEEFIAKNNLKIKLEYGVIPDRPYDSPIIYGNNERIVKIMADFKKNNIVK